MKKDGVFCSIFTLSRHNYSSFLSCKLEIDDVIRAYSMATKCKMKNTSGNN